MIRAVKLDDAAAIAEIYNYYVAHSIITFEEETVTGDIMRERINSVTEKFPWFVFEEDSVVLGYAYASAWKARSAYRFALESTVYLRSDATGKGTGKKLYSHLIAELKRQKYHTVIGGIALPNEASVALHESLGFVKTAHFKEVGYKFDRWIDVAYWQLML